MFPNGQIKKNGLSKFSFIRLDTTFYTGGMKSAHLHPRQPCWYNERLEEWLVSA